MDAASSISVCVRVRPFTVREAAQLCPTNDGPLFLGDGALASTPQPRQSAKGLRSVIRVVDEKCLIFDPPDDSHVQKLGRTFGPPGKRVKDQRFGFDRIFDENARQQDVYEATTKNLLDSVLDGYNATVFAYGATGCGKTHTISGTPQEPGIIYLTMQELFEKKKELSEKEIEVSLSYLEIYNETIRDLLNPDSVPGKNGLMLREDSAQTVSVAGLSSHRPQGVHEVMEMIREGNDRRTVSPTAANAVSSRSHAVLQINVAQRNLGDGIEEAHIVGTLSIIDLAGSERASATLNRGERLLEGANINKSLLALGGCINALCDPRRRNHVPYRNSKLTRLLKFSLGGNCRTVMIVCVSPSSAHFDETQNTLRYANRAKNIQTKVTRNIFNVDRHVRDYVMKIQEQATQIQELQKQQQEYEKLAFERFGKQNGKRDSIIKDGIARLRSAYDTSSQERHEKKTNIQRLRQVERRIGVLGAWADIFDEFTEHEADASEALFAIRKTAQGILLELEQSRAHYQSKVAQNNWDRQITTALSDVCRLLDDGVATAEGLDASNLHREAELLRSRGEMEVLHAVMDFDRGGDLATVSALLKANLETVQVLRGLMSMSDEQAMHEARSILTNLLQRCTHSLSQVVKPDANAPIMEAFLPRSSGTPKRARHTLTSFDQPPPVLSAEPRQSLSIPSMSSPLKMTPRRRKAVVVRKGSASPKKRSPSKSKRGVRWRDEADVGAIADYSSTPKVNIDSSESLSGEIGSEESPELVKPELNTQVFENVHPQIPLGSVKVALAPLGGRFKAGALTKQRTAGSPPPPTMTHLSSDSDNSPLRVLTASKLNRRVSSGLRDVSHINGDSASGSENEKVDLVDALKVNQALKARRVSTSRQSLSATSKTHRRRSPTATGSPPNDSANGIFTASHARRMPKSEKEVDRDVLSPKVTPIMKAPVRRSTMSIESRREMTKANAALVQRLTGSIGSRHSLVNGTTTSTPAGTTNKAVWRAAG